MNIINFETIENKLIKEIFIRKFKKINDVIIKNKLSEYLLNFKIKFSL